MHSSNFLLLISLSFYRKNELNENSNDKWMNVDLGYLPHGKKHSDTKSSNNLLKDFYPVVSMHIPSKSLFRKYFIQEKCRQWNIQKQKDKLEQTFQFLQSENRAAIGNRLQEGYIPKPNDANVLADVAKKLSSLPTKVDELVNEIKCHDESIFDDKGLALKKKWYRMHHDCNKKYIASLRQTRVEINNVLQKVEALSKNSVRSANKGVVRNEALLAAKEKMTRTMKNERK